MTREEVYRLLVDAVNSGKLQEPFTTLEFRKACPGLSVGTYRAFVWRHSRQERTTNVLLEHIGSGRFRLVRPLSEIVSI